MPSKKQRKRRSQLDPTSSDEPLSPPKSVKIDLSRNCITTFDTHAKTMTIKPASSNSRTTSPSDSPKSVLKRHKIISNSGGKDGSKREVGKTPESTLPTSSSVESVETLTQEPLSNLPMKSEKMVDNQGDVLENSGASPAIIEKIVQSLAEVQLNETSTSKKKKKKKKKKKAAVAVEEDENNQVKAETLIDLRRDSKLDLESSTELLEKEQLESPSMTLPKYDYYQTSDRVILSIYAKNVSEEHVSIKYGHDALVVQIMHEQEYLYAFSLEREILPKDCVYSVRPVKIEISLLKKDKRIWAGFGKLVNQEDVLDRLISDDSWTDVSDDPIDESLDSDQILVEAEQLLERQKELESKEGLQDDESDLTLEAKGIKFLPRYNAHLDLSLVDSDDESEVVENNETLPEPTVATLARFSRRKIKDKLDSIGLLNMGNTCFVNSIIQCLCSIPTQFVDYFLDGHYLADINTENPLAHKGEVAKAFADILVRLDSEKEAFCPREFLQTLQNYSSLFDTYQQHDSQEFLNWLLDAVHEDVNKVLKKPYIELPDYDDTTADEIIASEYWNAHRKRNDSVIVDSFYGMYKSKITCKECGKNSIKFDPFMNLTVEVPCNPVNVSVYIINEMMDKHKFNMTVSSLNVTVGDMRVALEEKFCGPGEMLLGAIIVNCQVRDGLQDDRPLSHYHSFINNMCFYIVQDSPDVAFISTSNLVVPQSTSMTFGFPIVATVPHGAYSKRNLYLLLLEKLQKVLSLPLEKLAASKSEIFDVRWEGQESDSDEYQLEPLRNHALELVWQPKTVSIFFDEEKDREYTVSGEQAAYKNSVDLSECIQHHLKEEEVDEWYCPSCKKHNKGLKKLDIWKLPEIFIVHIKRFIQHPRLLVWTKRDVLVDFPVDELDVSSFTLGESSQDGLYELFAVSNHFGGMSSGHYTAFCKLGNTWHHFDDEDVCEIQDATLDQRGAYLLFYKRKSQISSV